jgi:hypothetical protein
MRFRIPILLLGLSALLPGCRDDQLTAPQEVRYNHSPGHGGGGDQEAGSYALLTLDTRWSQTTGINDAGTIVGRKAATTYGMRRCGRTVSPSRCPRPARPSPASTTRESPSAGSRTTLILSASTVAASSTATVKWFRSAATTSTSTASSARSSSPARWMTTACSRGTSTIMEPLSPTGPVHEAGRVVAPLRVRVAGGVGHHVHQGGSADLDQQSWADGWMGVVHHRSRGLGSGIVRRPARGRRVCAIISPTRKSS